MKTYQIPQIKLSYVSDAGAEQPKICDSYAAFKMLRETFDEDDIELREYVKVPYLSNSNKVLGVHTVSMGGVEHSPVDPKLVFAGALLAKASGIILCHNHPSGILRPSLHDFELTKRINIGCKILGISMFDHIIVSKDNELYYSFNDEGELRIIDKEKENKEDK